VDRGRRRRAALYRLRDAGALRRRQHPGRDCTVA
jgi:hypothetical protein